MRTIGFFCTLFTTVCAVCKGRTCWVPGDGDIILDAADALGVDLETFKKWNPEHPNLDNIHTTDIFAVSSVGPLKDAVWMTSDGTRFLSLVATSDPGYETSVGTGGRRSLRLTEAPTTRKTTFTATPTLDSVESSSPTQVSSTARTLSPSVKSSTSVPSRSTSVTEEESTAIYHTSTTSAESVKPTPPCGGVVNGLPLLCNARNDGKYFTNEDNLESFIKDFCREFGGQEYVRAWFSDARPDPEKSSITYSLWAAPLPGCKATRLQAMPSEEDCKGRLHDTIKRCGCNGGTGGVIVDEESCMAMHYAPTRKDSAPAGFNAAWGLDYVHDFVEGRLQGPEYAGNMWSY